MVDRLYLAGNSLSPPPPTSKLRELYKGLFRPLEELLDSRTVLFIAHKELQNLPLEMLQNEQGQYLLQFYDFSYLPSSYQLLQASSPTRSAPVMVSLDSSPPLTEAGREEVFFKTLFPNIQVVKELADLPRTARWVHIASHFRMDDRFWLVSGLEKDAEKLNILSLLNTPLSCSLLSLGVCEAGNGYSSGSPYWLGFTELLLTQKVEALIVSRWRMDERSSGIYRRFYALCRRGLSMDEALSQARRHFLVKALRRRNSKVSAGHPFFWAGITYVGLPGKKLYEVSERHTRSFFPLGVSLCLVGLSAALVLAHVCHFLTLPG